MTQFDQYVNKGKDLERLPLYDYVACVKMIRVRKRQNSTIEIGAEDGNQVPHRGRPRHRSYSFEMGGVSMNRLPRSFRPFRRYLR